MFTSKSASLSTNTYCLAKTRRFSRRSNNSVRSVTQEREALTDTVELVLLISSTSKYAAIVRWLKSSFQKVGGRPAATAPSALITHV